MSDWSEIERATREQAAAFVETPLEIGDRIAWAEFSYGKMDGISEVHRAATTEETYCGVKIPPAVCRLDLHVWPADLMRCKWCEIAWTQAARGVSA